MNIIKNDEINIVIPYLTNTLIRTNIDKTLYASELVEGVNSYFPGAKFTQLRLRVCINYMRKTGVPVMSGNKGYWISYDKIDLINMITSLENRAKSIESASKGLRKILSNL